jgi:hypothetical protein
VLNGSLTGRVPRATREAVQIAIRIAEDVSPTLRAAWREVQLRHARALGRISHLHRERLQVGSGSLGHLSFLSHVAWPAFPAQEYHTPRSNNVKTENEYEIFG